MSIMIQFYIAKKIWKEDPLERQNKLNYNKSSNSLPTTDNENMLILSCSQLQSEYCPQSQYMGPSFQNNHQQYIYVQFKLESVYR